jgi:hypothetical protein
VAETASTSTQKADYRWPLVDSDVEKSAAADSVAQAARTSTSKHRLIIFVATAAALLLVAIILWPGFFLLLLFVSLVLYALANSYWFVFSGGAESVDYGIRRGFIQLLVVMLRSPMPAARHGGLLPIA